MILPSFERLKDQCFLSRFFLVLWFYNVKEDDPLEGLILSFAMVTRSKVLSCSILGFLLRI